MIPTYTQLKEVKDYLFGQPKGTQCLLKIDSDGATVQNNLRIQYGTYTSYSTQSLGHYLLTFDHYDQAKVDEWHKRQSERTGSKNKGDKPTWKDIKDATAVGDKVYVEMNKGTLRKRIAKHWGGGSGAGVASIIGNGNGWDVTRLK